MKNLLKGLLSVVVIFIIGACSTASEPSYYPVSEHLVILTADTLPGIIFPDYDIVTEDHSHGYDYPKDKVYYKYINQNGTDSIYALEELIVLYRKNIKIENAWYVGKSHNCIYNWGPPPPQFLLMLDKENDALLKYNYQKYPVPLVSNCDDNVKKYILFGE